MTIPREAARLGNVQAPIMAHVMELVNQNPGTISLGQGVAHYGPPESVCIQAGDFLSTPQAHGYGFGIGDGAVRATVLEKVRSENQLAGDFEVVITAGSNMAFFESVLCITDPGDEIILLTPYYFNHEMTARIANCNPVVVPPGPDFMPDIAAIRASISSRSRAIVTVSPNNPTGVVYPSSVLEEINQLCAEYGLYHISDEAYEYFTFDRERHYSPGAGQGASSHTISIFSLSKSYGMAGWRLGYMAVPSHLLPAIKKVQDCNVICASLTSQNAAMKALEVGGDYCRQYLSGLDTVRTMVMEKLQSLGSRVQISPAKGAFYVFANMETSMSSYSVCEQLIRDYKIAVIPGSVFGHDRSSFRISYGNSTMSVVAEGMERLIRGLDVLLK